ncbi:TPA: D-glycero-beta-D-manno-heptose 1,7-bisphosphate 7-phosphatase [Legionella pneumophila]|uniref:D,D-heptose 1,7-bisphosphate phosphatase n=2 Tax=Legionella pneumophila TaxID=446 RepID=Q5ZUG0_LEGPH|nr:D-glycero-beta-D-manno-heptose 1,7-bisphosphate 7-phosphatase [Legionella pneumophila]WBV64164.1 D-glycero-beta-D-manno-heptose 1,7-bisphosphate 7-phosphatase [Legionella pneumophila 130b]AAU27917.1 histidinol phosphate phosphatase [Legionella pneumophila subsp. pneumophila str. Philadelphia 1]AEW52039.1 histidinol phosphate phosphatase [Legionella pneumophila subsp. pneumophila ATCC 43290]AGH53439.1 phosphatase, putative [Legionella pneumophila subsp. pneumophila LPE509]AGN14725.1 D-glycer
MNRIILLDRDGVINTDSINYIKNVDELIIIPDSIIAIARLSAAGYKIGVATNQSGVSRGLYSEDDLSAIHCKLREVLAEAGGQIDALEYCIHLPEDNCFCRKPQPGMLKALAEKLNCSLDSVPFVGDRVSDIQAALAVGAQPIIVLSNMTDMSELAQYPKVPIYNSLLQYVNQLLL